MWVMRAAAQMVRMCFTNWEGAKLLCFWKTNGRKINDDCQRKLSLYFLMDGGWFSARREIVFFVCDKQNDAKQNLLLHYPIFAQIDCTLLLTLMLFYFTEGHCDLKIEVSSITAEFCLWNMSNRKRNFSFSCIAGKFTFNLYFISFFAQWIHCRAWYCKKVHLIKKQITPKMFCSVCLIYKGHCESFFLWTKTNSRFSRRKLFASVVLMCAHCKWHKISTVLCLWGKWVLKMKYKYIIHILWSIASAGVLKQLIATTFHNLFNVRAFCNVWKWTNKISLGLTEIVRI